jgi:ABC-type glycerol-3-phosphate transport system substrate-binding protein
MREALQMPVSKDQLQAAIMSPGGSLPSMQSMFSSYFPMLTPLPAGVSAPPTVPQVSQQQQQQQQQQQYGGAGRGRPPPPPPPQQQPDGSRRVPTVSTGPVTPPLPATNAAALEMQAHQRVLDVRSHMEQTKAHLVGSWHNHAILFHFCFPMCTCASLARAHVSDR